MGQVFGIFAKKNGELVTNRPIMADEESHFGLSNILGGGEKYVEGVLAKSNLEQATKDWLKLTSDERETLKYNNILDFANDEIVYRQSANQPLKDGFFAMDFVHSHREGDLIYSPKYKHLEHWVEPRILQDALYKINRVLYEDLKQTIEARQDTDYKRYTYDNIGILLNTVRTLQKVLQIDEVALVYGPY
jgi:hypothetical protein